MFGATLLEFTGYMVGSRMKIFSSTSMFAALFTASMFMSAPANACSFDTDCNIGSKCVKSATAVKGACLSGVFSGGSTLDLLSYSGESTNGANSTYGKSCTFNKECGDGLNCRKAGGMFGVCT